MSKTFINFLTKLTTGESQMVVTAETASFDETRVSASALLIASASLTFDQMYAVETKVFWNAPMSQSVTNYRIAAADQSPAALQAAYVLSSSFLA